nr:DNA repair protein XRCC1-like [Lytechinus pictus]
MAPVKLKNVVSFSSQDTDHCAKNLLETNQWRRWLCAPGDRSGSVQAEFQLERAVRIGFIDIGNYGSALIEILVRRSSASDDQFKTLVPTTSCMTPMDSKQGKNKTGVKMFSRDQLCEDARDEYWDRIKVVCRQPFKKDAQFGLAFIKISSIEEKENVAEDRQPHVMHTEIKKPVPKPKPVQKQEKVSILSPSWKSNAAFQKKVNAINPGESSATLDLKDRLVRIESTSESKSQSGHSLGRAAQIILAASGKRAPSSTSQSSINNENSSTSSSSGATMPTASLSTPQPPPSSSSSSSTGTKRAKGKNKTSVLEQPPDDAALLLEEQVKEFLSHVGPALKDATLTELRPKFESCLGRKLVKSEKAIFKRLAIHAVEALDDPAGTDIPDIGLRRTSKKENGWLQAKPTPSIPNVGPCSKDAGSQNNRWSQANSSRPSIPISGPARNSKNNGCLQSSPPSASSSPPVRDDIRIPYSGINPKDPGDKGRDLPSWMNSPAQSGEGKPCPKCGGLFPASRMNVHIWDCRGKRESTPVRSSQSPATHLKRRANSLIHEHLNESSSKRQIGGGIVGGGVPMATDNAATSGINNGEEDMWTPRRGGRGSKHGSNGRTGRGRGGKNNGQTNAASTPGRGRGRGIGRGRGKGGTKSSTKKGKKATSVEYVEPLSSSDDEVDHMTPSTSVRGRGQRRGRGQPRGRGQGRGQARSPANGLQNPWTNSPGSSDVSDDMDTSYHDPRPGMLMDLVPCPICNQEFPQCSIETHAAFCGESGGGMHDGGLGLGGFGALSGGFLRDVEAAIWVD